MDGVNDFESSITSMSDMWAMDKSFFKLDEILYDRANSILIEP